MKFRPRIVYKVKGDDAKQGNTVHNEQYGYGYCSLSAAISNNSEISRRRRQLLLLLLLFTHWPSNSIVHLFNISLLAVRIVFFKG